MLIIILCCRSWGNRELSKQTSLSSSRPVFCSFEKSNYFCNWKIYHLHPSVQMFKHVFFKEGVVARDGGGVAGWFCAVTARIGRVIVSGTCQRGGGRAGGQKPQNNLHSLSSTSKNAFKANVSEDRTRRRTIIFVTF